MAPELVPPASYLQRLMLFVSFQEVLSVMAMAHPMLLAQSGATPPPLLLLGPTRGSLAAGSSSGGGDFLPSEEDGLVPASQWKRGASRHIVQARIEQARAAGLTGGPFTLFDEIAGPRILSRRPEWSRRQRVFHAIDVSQVPDPAGRMLNAPVPGWPCGSRFQLWLVVKSRGVLLGT